MPQTLTIPFHAFRLQLQDGDSVTVPLSDIEALHLKKPIEDLSKKYQEQFQKKLLNAGKYKVVLDELQGDVFEQKTLEVEFPASKDGITHPTINLSFEYFQKKIGEIFWGIVPSMGIEATGDDESSLKQRLEEVIRVDFSSKKRLKYLQSIFNAIWFKEVSLQTAHNEMTFYSPSELTDIQKEEKKKLLLSLIHI